MSRSGAFALLTSALVLAAASPVFADGPFEPNESAAEAAGPLLGGTISAALETPQDHDWYRFYAFPERQVGVLATLAAPCSTSYGFISVDVYDADADDSVIPLGVVTLGHDYYNSGKQSVAGQVTFTTQMGHRYLVKVTESSCVGSAYTLGLTPPEDLTSTLQDTLPCAQAKVHARQAAARVSSLRRRVLKAHGAHRRRLRDRLALQRQAAVVAASGVAGECTRSPLTGYPWT